MWRMQIGGADLTSYVTNLHLSETASYSQDTGSITINGQHTEAVAGASVFLFDAQGFVAWEGIITTCNDYGNSTGLSVATYASLCGVAATGGSSSGNDIAVLAAQLLANTSTPWGDSATLGVEVGGLTFHRVDEALTVLAYLGGYTWRTRSGDVIFVNADSGITSIPVALQTSSNSYSAVHIRAGADVSTRIPLETTVTPIGSPSGPVGQVSFPEIADSGTLGIMAGSYASMYGRGSVSATAVLSQTVRAGDWVQDTNGVVAVAWNVQWDIVSGLLQNTVQFGFPALPTQPQYSQSFSDAMHRYPVARLASDYVVLGGSISISGSTVTVAAGIVVLADTLYSLSQQSLTPPSGVSYIIATSTAFAVSAQPSTVPGSTMTLWQVTVTNGVITQTLDLRPHGGAGSNNVQPNALYPVHFSGDTSGDRSVAIFNGGTKTINHGVMSQPTQARILGDKTLLVDGTTGPVSGNLPHPNMATSYTGNFSSAGALLASSTMNANVPNSSAYFSDFTIQYYVSGASPNFSVALWYDNGAGADAHIYLPNYTTTPGDRDINIGHTTQASPNKTLAGIATNQTIFVLAYYTPGTGVTFAAQTSAFTPANVRASVQDGGYVAAYATVGTGATFTVTGAGGGSTGGNGGKIPNTY